jgi:hypothetical protein
LPQDPIRAVVMAKRIILVVPDGADSLISILDQYMKGIYCSYSLSLLSPFSDFCCLVE